MTEIDEFASSLFEEAKWFLEKAKRSKPDVKKDAYFHAALVIGVSSIEAHINSISEEMLQRNDLDILAKSVLSECEYRLEDGEFVLKENLRMYRLLDRFEFIYNQFGHYKLDKDEPWWGELNQTINLRNDLMHPKEQVSLSYSTIRRALLSILGGLDSIFNCLYGEDYPASGRRLHSNIGL